MLKRTLLSAPIAAATVLIAAPQPRAGLFTPEQSSSGRSAYQVNCATCHGPDLAGRNEAPQLAGNNFIASWGKRTTRDLTVFIQTTMPPAAPGSLAEKTCLEIVAYLLESNGAVSGAQSLVSSANSAIGS